MSFLGSDANCMFCGRACGSQTVCSVCQGREERESWALARRNARIAKRKEEERMRAEGTICGFGLVYGYCHKPAINGRCQAHAETKCANCDSLASHECDYIGMLVCGFPICDKCEHPHGKKR